MKKNTVELKELIFSPFINLEDIALQLAQIFDTQIENIYDANDSKNNNIFTFKNDGMLMIFTVHTKDEDKKYTEEQLKGVYDYFYQINTEHLEIKRNLLHHLHMCQSVIEIYASYNESNQDDEALVINQILDTTINLNGLLTNGMEMLCNGMGKCILDVDGDSDFEYYMPPMYPIPDSWKEEFPEYCERRERSIKLLQEKHLYTMSLLPLISENETDEGRSIRDICCRAVALLVVAIYSECRLGENMSYNEAKQFVQHIIDNFGAEDFFSPNESEYLNNPDSTQQEQIQFAWQYENLLVMEWALGLTDSLPWPEHICDVPATVRAIKNFSNIDELIATAVLRDRKEILDNADLIYLLHWACVDARVCGLPAPQDLDEGVVMERHHALFWIAGCDNFCDWDNVDLST